MLGCPFYVVQLPSNGRSRVSTGSINLKRLSPKPTFDEIKEAILYYVVDAPAMLGTPSDIHQAAHDFAGKMYNKL